MVNRVRLSTNYTFFQERADRAILLIMVGLSNPAIKWAYFIQEIKFFILD